MSNNRIAANYEFFVNLQLSLQLVRAVGDLLTGLTIHRARVKHTDSYSSFVMSTCNPIKYDMDVTSLCTK